MTFRDPQSENQTQLTFCIEHRSLHHTDLDNIVNLYKQLSIQHILPHL